MRLRTSQIALLILVILSALTNVRCSNRTDPAAAANGSKLECDQRGIASWYGTNMKGRLTASGDKYDPKALTAASKKYPMGTELHVINLENNKDVTVTVNDRGPYSGKRIIDMSVGAAHELDMKKAGVANVCVQNTEQAGQTNPPGAPVKK